jgi:uroporphyrinogen-III synthase
MPVLVTRPEPQASAWVADLRGQGVDAHALPLIAIEGPAQPQAVQHLWQTLPSQRLLMFVSPAAVAWFFKLRPDGLMWPAGTLAATPGPGTARALQEAGRAVGLPVEQILCPDTDAAQFDSESLWPVLSPLDWQDQHVSIISGGDQNEAIGRNWLTAQWQARGAQVQSVLTYQRGAGQWSPSQQALAHQALQAPADHIWLFSSSQAIDLLVSHHLPMLAASQPDILPVDWSGARALCTHPKIAQKAAQLGFSRIEQARPTLDAVVQALRTAY